MNKSYMEQRFDKMKRLFILKNSSAAMFIGLILLIFILFFGKMFFDWAVDKSHNHVDEYELRAYKNSKYKYLVDQRAKGNITKEQLQQMVDSIETNAKRDFIKERR